MSHNQLFTLAAQMQRYKELTDLHGPQQILIDFINYDKTLGGEIGFESLDALSTQAQHEILLTQLNPDDAFDAACEGFLSSVGFHFGIYKRGKEVDATVEHIADTHWLEDESKSEVVIPTYKGVSGDIEYLLSILTFVSRMFDAMPTTVDPVEWEKYESFIKHTLEPEYAKISHFVYSDAEKFGKGSRAKNAGWSPEKLNGCAKELLKGITASEQFEKTHAPRFAKLAAAVDEAKKSDEGKKAIRDCAAAVKQDISQYKLIKAVSWTKVTSELKKAASVFKVAD